MLNIVKLSKGYLGSINTGHVHNMAVQTSMRRTRENKNIFYINVCLRVQGERK